MLIRVVVLSVLAATAACAGAPRQRPIPMGRVETGPHSLAAARRFLEGRWTLESLDLFPIGSPPIRLTGAGTLTYDQYGNLEIKIRTDEKTADLLRQAGIETDGGILTTDGRTVIDLQNRTLTYVVKDQPTGRASGPLSPNRPRHWEIDDGLLTLSTRDDNGTPVSVARWRKEQ